MTTEPEIEFFIEEAVLDRLDELADVQLQPGGATTRPTSF